MFGIGSGRTFQWFRQDFCELIESSYIGAQRNSSVLLIVHSTKLQHVSVLEFNCCLGAQDTAKILQDGHMLQGFASDQRYQHCAWIKFRFYPGDLKQYKKIWL